MHHFHVPNMTCGHCVKKITQAIQSVDPLAQLQADLAAKSVAINSGAPAAQLSAAMAAAGYANTPRA